MNIIKSNNPTKAIPVYIITRTGKTYNDKGIVHINNMVYKKTSDGLPEDADGIIAYMGKNLLDAKLLADMLRQNNLARVFISLEDGIGIAPYGPDEDELPSVIKDLEEAAKNNIDSWTALKAKIDEENA